MTTKTKAGTTTQIHRIWIKATPQAIWDAITKPEWIDRYGYGGLPEYGDLRPGTKYEILAGTGMQAYGVKGPVIDGEIIEVDPPRRFVQTWRMLMEPKLQAEGFTRLTYEIEAQKDGVTRLTIIHDLENAPMLYALVAGENESEGAGGGWAWVLSDLKTLLETGKTLAATS
jgi:uncharacterized protein YndB with AHSA1/START domain